MENYKGYSAKISLDEEQGVFHGDVVGITDVVTFEGKTPEELTKAFHDSVDDYLSFCEEREEKPDKPYSGRFVLRLSPELHRRVAVAAKNVDMSMNEWIVALVEESLERTSCPGASPDRQNRLLERLASIRSSGLTGFIDQSVPAYDWRLPVLLAGLSRPHVSAEVSSLLSALTATLAEEESGKTPKRSARRIR